MAALLGHVDGTMLCKNYEHVSSDAAHLRNQLNKGAAATGQAEAATQKTPKQSKPKRRQKVA